MLVKTNIIFWQNILSIHQSSFIRNLAEIHAVCLVVEEGLDETRIKHGWTIPDFGNAKVVVKPNEIQIEELLNLTNAIHVFTGIDSFPLPAKVFKMAVNQKRSIGVMLEPFNILGFKGKLRFIKYKLLALQYRNKIDFILAISDNAIQCYKKVGFDSKTIFDWIYFTEKTSVCETKSNSRLVPKLLFVGSIDERKNILPTVKKIISFEDKIDSFEIAGVGSLENDLKRIIRKSDKIKYLGGIPNKQIAGKIAEVDLLILPSIFDGWGAVVNEALQQGTPVLVSENSGASCLINEQRGRVFSHQKNNFVGVLEDYLKELPIDKNQRESIENWADEKLSGNEGRDYFLNIVDCVFNDKSKPVAPWKLD